MSPNHLGGGTHCGRFMGTSQRRSTKEEASALAIPLGGVQMMERLLAKYIDVKTAEEGQTMVEYALVLALMVVVIAALFTGTGLDEAVGQAITDTINSFS